MDTENGGEGNDSGTGNSRQGGAMEYSIARPTLSKVWIRAKTFWNIGLRVVVSALRFLW
jgi:hypothetical protein